MMQTVVALLCFAGNSLLCRYALGEGNIDAASFTTVRLATGALVLTALVRPSFRRSGIMPSFALLVYAGCFSFAYDHVTAATGALLLFGAVQVTMLVGTLMLGVRLSASQWSGLVVALSGLVYLLSPGLEAPSTLGSALMLASGAAWGIYCMKGAQASVAQHFVFAAPLAALVNLFFLGDVRLSPEGFVAAAVSGGVTSGLGYWLWFRALGKLSGITAATVQLSVPVLTAMGGTWLLSEPLSIRLLVASLVVVSGIALTLPVPRRWRVRWPDMVARLFAPGARP